MSTAAILRVKDEADIITSTIRHLSGQVDEIIVADNLSTDGTRELLHDLTDGLPLVVVHDDVYAHYAGVVYTSLAQQALGRGHEWVVPCDADEIWFAPGSTLRARLAAATRRTRFVSAFLYNHVTTALDEPDEADPVVRVGWRKREPMSQQWRRIACRLRADLEIAQGNHSARISGGQKTEAGLGKSVV